MDDTINYARENGFVQTILGRRRYLRDILSTNAVVRGFAERNAINAPIQGSAADMIKVAMIHVHEACKNTISKQSCSCKCMMNWSLTCRSTKWKK